MPSRLSLLPIYELTSAGVPLFTAWHRHRRQPAPRRVCSARSRPSLIFWDMGISQYIRATDNARALIARALITGQIGRPGTGLHPLRRQNTCRAPPAPHERVAWRFHPSGDTPRRGRTQGAFGSRRAGKHGVHAVLLRRSGSEPAENPALDPFGKVPEFKLCAVRAERAEVRRAAE